MAFPQLVPYAVLRKFGSGDEIVIGSNTENPFKDGEMSFIGLSSVQIKHAGSYVEVLPTIEISQNHIIGASNGSLIGRLFSFGGGFKLEYGWQGGDNPNFRAKLSDLKLAGRPGMEYNSKTKSFTISLQLVSANAMVLKEIKIGNPIVLDEVRKIEKKIWMGISEELAPDGSPTPFISAGSQPNYLSLGGVISELLTACRERLSEIQKFSIGYGPKAAEGQYSGTPFVETTQTQQTRENSKDQPEATSQATSILLMNAVPEDIPLPSDIRLITFDVEGPPSVKGGDLGASFSTKPMADKSNLFDLINAGDHNNVSVLQFIDSLLNSNGYTIWQTPDVIDNEGRMKWTILQNRFNNIGNSSSYEFSNMMDPESVVIDPVGVSFKTILNKEGNLDVHSNKNVILSVKANVDAGETSIYSLAVQDRHSQASGEDELQPADNVAHIASLYDSLAQEAKEVNLDVLGMPSLSLFDDLEFKMCGTLFSGKYKIIELTHDISSSQGFITSIRMIQTKEGLKQNQTSGGDTKAVPAAGNEIGDGDVALPTEVKVTDRNNMKMSIPKKERVGWDGS